MPARKTQILKYVSNMLFPLFPCTSWGAYWLGIFSIALIFILFQPAEKSYLASMTVHMVIDRGPRQAQNSTSEALKHWCSLTPIEKISSQWTHHSRLRYPNFDEFVQKCSKFTWPYTRKTENLQNSTIFQLKQEKICQIKALPPFKWKPIDFWLVYSGDNHITKIAWYTLNFLKSPLGCTWPYRVL